MPGLIAGAPITQILGITINTKTRDLLHIGSNIGMMAEILLLLNQKTWSPKIAMTPKKLMIMSKKMPWYRIGSRIG